MQNEPFVIERTFNAPVAKVWKAITNNDEMKQWYFNLAEFKPEVGFKFSFTAGANDGIKYIHQCEVTEVVDEKKLTYSWCYENYAGNSLVTFELFAEGNKTRLKLTHAGIETFAANGKDFQKESFAQGWDFIIGKSLREYLDKVK
jgi:uncharacterized protein YndB with AHSA1/START domain